MFGSGTSGYLNFSNEPVLHRRYLAEGISREDSGGSPALPIDADPALQGYAPPFPQVNPHPSQQLHLHASSIHPNGSGPMNTAEILAINQSGRVPIVPSGSVAMALDISNITVSLPDLLQSPNNISSSGLPARSSTHNQEDHKTATLLDNSPDPNDLANWTDYVDKASGKTYWHNKITKKSVWERPPGYLSASEKKEPISSESIDENWIVIFTRGGSSYYHNKSTKETSWTLPDELNTPAPGSNMQSAEHIPRLSTDDPIDPEPVANGALKRELEFESDKIDGEPPMKKQKIESAGDQAISHFHTEAELKSEEALLRYEEEKLAEQQRLQAEEAELLRSEQLATEWQERHRVFRELLAEQKFAPFTSWKKAQPQLVYDSRYSALLTDADRKTAFESFMRHHIVETNRQSSLSKKAKKESLVNSLRKLVDENKSLLSHSTTLEEFNSLFESDDRWSHASKSERLALYHNSVGLLKAEQETRQMQAAKEFTDMLKEHDFDLSSRWSKVCDRFRDDPRYHEDILTSVERAQLFQDRLKEIKKSQELKDTQKRREEIRRREREREVKAERSVTEELMKSERNRLLRETEERDVVTMLAETVHDADMSWREVRHRISKDPRYQTRVLTSHDKEDLFIRRINSLREVREEFRSAILQSPSLDLNSTWGEIRAELLHNHRFNLIASDTSKEKIFKDVLNDAEKDFRALLMSFPKIGGDTKIDDKGLAELETLLRGDPRWRRFDRVPIRRQELLENYINDRKAGRVNYSDTHIRRI